MPTDRTHAKFEYELLGDYGKFVALYVGLLSVIHKQRIGSTLPPPFGGRAGFISAADGLADYFFGLHQGRKPKQIRANNTATQRRLAKFLVETHDQFAKGLAEKMPEPMRLLREQLRPDRSLAEQLKGLKVRLTTEIEFPTRDAEHEDINIIKPFLRVATASTDKYPEHPTLRGIPACDELALATECLGIVEAPGDPAWKRTGLFCVVREARGPYTNEVQDINLIVRDILWLRRCTGQDPSGQARDDERGPGGNIGFYFSPFDSTVYEVRNLVIRNGMMMFDAISFMETGAERSLCLYYPESLHDHPLHCREGIIMGTTRDEKRPGAWKALVVRPNWPDLGTLDAQLSVYLKRLENFDRVTYLDMITKCFEFVSNMNLAGVLYSREWSRRDSEIGKTRAQFRSMLWEKRAQSRREQILVGNRIDSELRSALLPILRTGGSSERTLNNVITKIQSILTDSWYLIEPAQIISSGYSHDTAKPDAIVKSGLQDFIRRERVLNYDQHATEFGKKTRNRK